MLSLKNSFLSHFVEAGLFTIFRFCWEQGVRGWGGKGWGECGEWGEAWQGQGTSRDMYQLTLNWANPISFTSSGISDPSQPEAWKWKTKKTQNLECWFVTSGFYRLVHVMAETRKDIFNMGTCVFCFFQRIKSLNDYWVLTPVRNLVIMLSNTENGGRDLLPLKIPPLKKVLCKHHNDLLSTAPQSST